MSISDKIQALEASRQAIATAITQKGGTVAQGDGFSQFATEISNLPSGGSGNPVLTSIDVDDFTGTTFEQATSYITDVTIPIGVTTIGDNAFYNATRMSSIAIPNSVSRISNGAFSRCFALASLTIPNSVNYLGERAFSYCNGITSLTIPSSVRTIGNECFTQCTGITSIVVPDSVTSLGSSVFAGCNHLTSAAVNCSSLSYGMFSGCAQLQSVEISSNATSFANRIFENCSSLSTVIVKATVPPTTESGTFLNIPSNTVFYVPASSLDTYKSANNWSTYASRIYPIAQVATVDGNPVYNYDLRMTSTDTITSEDMAKMPAGTSVEFAEGLTNIATGEINYQEVILPSTFTGFGDSDMIGSNVTTITSNAVTPPSVFRNQLGGSGLTAIYVPAASVDTYKAHATWSNFASIIQAIPSE